MELKTKLVSSPEQVQGFSPAEVYKFKAPSWCYMKKERDHPSFLSSSFCSNN
jgi:hypothetical protein